MQKGGMSNVIPFHMRVTSIVLVSFYVMVCTCKLNKIIIYHFVQIFLDLEIAFPNSFN